MVDVPIADHPVVCWRTTHRVLERTSAEGLGLGAMDGVGEGGGGGYLRPLQSP